MLFTKQPQRPEQRTNWEAVYRLNPALERAGVSLTAFLRNPMEVIENVLYSGVTDIRLDTQSLLPLLPKQAAVQAAIDYGTSGECYFNPK
jgi:hypothetical protein